jgi:hypothetical protein
MTQTKKDTSTAPPSGAGGASKEQKQYIYKLAAYNKDIKEEWVQWATNDNSKTSTNDLTRDQASAIIRQAGGTPNTSGKLEDRNWASFDSKNTQHVFILSLCRQLNWVISNEKHGKIADLNRLSNFLKSDKCPVRRPLKKMKPAEVSKIITALEGIIKSNYEK